MNTRVISIIRDTRAVASVEFALVLLPFFIMIAVIVETCIITYQISLIDSVVSSAGKYATSFKGEVSDRFEEFIKKDRGTFLSFILDDNEIIKEIKFCKNIEEISKNECVDEESNSRVAIFTVKYKVNPLFNAIRSFVEDEYVTSRMAFFIEKSRQENENTQR